MVKRTLSKQGSVEILGGEKKKRAWAIGKFGTRYRGSTGTGRCIWQGLVQEKRGTWMEKVAPSAGKGPSFQITN